ncbi:GTP cyclohydrolase I [Leifsonia xyli subsp. xyli]|uniref:GTP cyclohydrolase 1 n=2 Tax=Leifsonia xyli subsp. xyli TaxID=59736 RepID=GCH1_LEIXX|nr:GTP cyclohydrolase I FolE [Leifsonia xyli]Q6ACQ1.1 RecName: Full=GTP cyclohydrolase 1; AltName: Full=GTP cyclohydrolase I; Short=GTP-CH-I [Leifsonia xyli subsp. xyli str. CTCB07]AAT89842.1 GTP cyclohydrolase I [Leifsonia xyli subsp. xyli str. CTCB07]ODA89558.1 GTP cyclohydrolase I [Leifsonia xyli subsp. xyli]
MTGFDRARIEAAVAEILAAVGEDPSRPGLSATPSRVADAYAEFFAGLGRDAEAELGEPVPLEQGQAETVILREISFRSVCEHHLLPFIGVAHVAYLPGEAVIGLGRIPRVIDTLAARPQVQERLTEQIADTFEAGAGARGVLVVLSAEHGCVTARGPRQVAATTVTLAARGEFAEPAARAELIALIGCGAA